MQQQTPCAEPNGAPARLLLRLRGPVLPGRAVLLRERGAQLPGHRVGARGPVRGHCGDCRHPGGGLGRACAAPQAQRAGCSACGPPAHRCAPQGPSKGGLVQGRLQCLWSPCT